MRIRKELRTYRKWPFPCVPYLKMWCLVICELHRMLSNITVLRWTWALGSESRISGPRDASTRPRTRNRNHHQLVRFASRLLIFVSLCIASASSVFPHHPSPSDRRLSSNKHSRITRLVGHLANTHRLAQAAAPYSTVQYGSCRSQISRQLDSVWIHRRLERPIL